MFMMEKFKTVWNTVQTKYLVTILKNTPLVCIVGYFLYFYAGR